MSQNFGHHAIRSLVLIQQVKVTCIKITQTLILGWQISGTFKLKELNEHVTII